MDMLMAFLQQIIVQFHGFYNVPGYVGPCFPKAFRNSAGTIIGINQATRQPPQYGWEYLFRYSYRVIVDIDGSNQGYPDQTGKARVFQNVEKERPVPIAANRDI